MINRAYELAGEAHVGQTAQDGEPYINHPLAVARIVAEIGLDDITVAAALLHDAVEDTEITLADVERRVRRRGRAHRRRRHQARADPVRLQGGAAGGHDAQDAGRDGQGPAGAHHQAGRPAAQHAHDRRRCRSEKQQRIAQETLDIYAPLAHRLGHAGDEAAARGPVVRRVAPQALRRARPHGVHALARARDVPRAGRRRGPRAAGASSGSTPT